MRGPLILGGLLFVATAVVLAALPWVAASPNPRPALPDLGTVPAFSLTDRFGEPFDHTALEGKVWVADFMFTSCPTICPFMSRHLAAIQSQLIERGLADDVRLVGFSVDPETDTPEVLRAYGETYGADPDIWKLLTGERSDLWALCRDGFKLHVADNPEDTANPITHAGKFVLIDRSGVIRGYYDGTTPAVVDPLVADIAELVGGS